MTPLLSRLAVCSWSLQPANPEDLLKQIAALEIPRLQCALDPLREDPNVWGSFAAQVARQGVALVSGMFVTVGEDYSSLESIRRTGGLTPDATWEENWRNIQAVATIARELNLSLVTFHAGFLPHDPADAAFSRILERIRRVADFFAERKIDLALETGQETAETLRTFLDRLERPNVGVNFDPANMILYDKGDPIEALRVLAPWLRQCHIKDARRTKVPGTWGEEVPVGSGEVRWRDFFQALEAINYQGFFAIEREAGSQRLTDIRTARQFLQSSNFSR